MAGQFNDTQMLIERVHSERLEARYPTPRTHRASKLDIHSHHIHRMYAQGASIGDIRYFLRVIAVPSVTASRSTVHRYVLRHCRD